MLSDLRQAVRRLRHAPLFTLTAVLTLALGIGSTVAVFTFVDAVVFRPLPFEEPNRLVALSQSHAATAQDRIGVLPATFLDWRRHSTSLETLAMVGAASFLVTSRDEPARVAGATVSPAFFETLGVQPALGRTFPSADAPFAGVVAMSVAARTRELAIRIALGASAAAIRRLVVREAGIIVAAGAALGAAGAAAGTTFLRNQLVGVTTTDTPTWVAMVAILAAAGLIAAWLPARRAGRVDPIEALRQE